MAKVHLENISKSYGAKQVIRGLNLTIEDGECFTLLGPSGCGKSVILRMIAGFEPVDDGAITLGEEVVSSAAAKRCAPPEQRRIGVMFQDYAVWPHMTVYQNVSYPLKIQKQPKDVLDRRTREAIRQVNLEGYEGRLPSQLSGGQQQRVALARALVSRPVILLLDEPLSNLDANLREEMRFELKELQKRFGLTILYVTHDQEIALAISDRIGVMDETGRIRQVGSPQEIYDQPVDSYVFRFMGVTNIIQATRKNPSLCFGSTIPVEAALQPQDRTLVMGQAYAAGCRPFEIDLSREKGRYPATVVRSAFLGAQIDYRIAFCGHELRVQKDTAEALRDGGVFQEGEACYLTFNQLRWFDTSEIEA